jgi:hypothetical protein
MDADQEDEAAEFSGETSSKAFLIPSFICVHPVHLRFVPILSLLIALTVRRFRELAKLLPPHILAGIVKNHTPCRPRVSPLAATLLLSISSGLPAAPVLHEAGDLQLLLDSTLIPSEDSPDKYRLPTGGELTAFRKALRHVLAGDLQAAADEALAANYDVISYTDNVSGDVFTLLREKETDRHWGGIYVVDQTPERALVVQCPHPLFDGVRAPSADIFMDTNAFAFLMAGTHRKNSPVESLCDHDPNNDPYRISDMAHAPDSIFQAAHEVIEETIARTVSLSFHGMAQDSDPSNVSISNGTPREFPGNSLSRALAARINEILAGAADPRYAVSHQEPGENPALSGSTNTQGRHTNGSTNPCTEPARLAIFPERFIHMECAPDVRGGDPSNWAFITQTLNELIPLFSDPAPDLPVGDLVITEFMADPAQVGDGTGEYIELFNATGAPITMTNWTLYDTQFNTATFSGVIQPGDLFVVAVSNDINGAAPGGAPDAVWQDASGDFTLTNTGDYVIILDDDGDYVASVIYADGDLFGTGVSFELATGNAHPNGQTQDLHYVASTTPFGTDYGSPGIRGETGFPVIAPTLSAAVSIPDFLITFPTTPAVTYTLWNSPTLGGWQLLGGMPPLIGDGGPGVFTIPLPEDDRHFYRVLSEYAAPE